MGRIKYFYVVPHLEKHAPSSLFASEAKGELFLGPHVRLSGLSGMAHLESESLALQYAEVCAPVLQKRYGHETTLEVDSWDAMESKKLRATIKKHSSIVRKRIATGNLASNKAP
jgi:hypothetical protein